MVKPKQEKDGSVKLTKQTTAWLQKRFVDLHRAIDQAEATKSTDYLMPALIEDELNRRGIKVEITERKVCDYKFTKGGKA